MAPHNFDQAYVNTLKDVLFACERAITKKALVKAVYDRFLVGIHAWTHCSCEVVLADARVAVGKKKPKLNRELQKGGNTKNGTIEMLEPYAVKFDAQTSNGDTRRQRRNRKSLQTAANAAAEALKALDLSEGNQKKVTEFIT